MDTQEPKGLRAVIRRLIDHLNRHPADIGYYAAGVLFVLVLLTLTYGIGWQSGYSASRNPVNVEMPGKFLPPTRDETKRMLRGDHK